MFIRVHPSHWSGGQRDKSPGLSAGGHRPSAANSNITPLRPSISMQNECAETHLPLAFRE